MILLFFYIYISVTLLLVRTLTIDPSIQSNTQLKSLNTNSIVRIDEKYWLTVPPSSQLIAHDQMCGRHYRVSEVDIHGKKSWKENRQSRE